MSRLRFLAQGLGLLAAVMSLAVPGGCETSAAATLNQQLDHLRVGQRSGQSLSLEWDSTLTSHEIDYRPEASSAWQTVKSVNETSYNLIMLEPSTRYEVRVRGLRGEGAPETSISLFAQTTSSTPSRHFAGFELPPTRHLDTFTSQGGVWYPTLEYAEGFLWAVEYYGGSIHLSKVKPGSYDVLWTKEIIPQGRNDRSVYQGIMDTTVLRSKLYVCWNFQDTNNPEGYQITQSRQILKSYDLATGELSDPVEIKAAKPGAGAWEGGVEAWNGKLWVMNMDAWMEGKNRRTRIVLRSFEGGKFSEPIVYDNCPTPYPYGPSISVYKDKLLLMFSDLAAYEKDKNREPLYYTLFDGKSFSPARLVYDNGRSRYAKGVQMGDQFVCVFKTNAPYYKSEGYKYHDIAFSVIEPLTGKVQTTMAVDDLKYNSSPDITRLDDNHALFVYGKFEHNYTNKADPVTNHGGFIGEIRRGQ